MVEWKTYGKQGGYTISYICPTCGYETMDKSEECPRCEKLMHNIMDKAEVKEYEIIPKLWSYTKPNQMTGHRFSDDVAITFADTKEEAITYFKQLYSSVKPLDVKEVFFNDLGVAILTDY